MSWNYYFSATLAIASDGTAENVPISFNFSEHPLVLAGQTVTSARATQVVPSGYSALSLTVGTIAANVVPVQVTLTNGSVNQQYMICVIATTNLNCEIELFCELSTVGTGYVAFQSGSNQPFSQVDSSHMTATGIAADTYGGTGLNVSYTIDAAGRVIKAQSNPLVPSSTYANLPAANSLPSGTVILLTDHTQGYIATNGTSWVEINGGVIISTSFNDDPTGATSSYTAWQAALTALAQIGGGKLLIPAPPLPSGFYYFDKTLVVQPSGSNFNCTICIEFLGVQNQIEWRGPAYSVGVLTMGNYNFEYKNFSPRNNVTNNDGFVAFDFRIDYWHPFQTQGRLIHCAPNLGNYTGVSGKNGLNGVGFRTGQGGTPASVTGGAGLDHGNFIECSVYSQSGTTFNSATVECYGIALQVGGNNSHPTKDNIYDNGCWYGYWAGAMYTGPTSPYFGPNDSTINVVSTNGFPPSGFLLISPTFQSSPCELVYYSGITATSFTGLKRGLNGTSPLQGTTNTIISVFHVDVLTNFAITTATVNQGDLSISVNSNNTLTSSGTIQINQSTGMIAGQCYDYETINYSSNSSGVLTIPSSGGRSQFGSPNISFPFNLPSPLVTTLSVTTGGTWTAQTAWVQLTYTNANGETTASPIVSIAVPTNYVLNIAFPYTTSYTSNSPATGWNVYVGTGATQPTNGAMYKQNTSPLTSFNTGSGGSYTISANPTATGNNPPTTSTAVGGNGYAVFQRQYGPSMGSLLIDGTIKFDHPSTSGSTNRFAFNGPHNVTIDHDECEGIRGQYQFTGLLPGLGTPSTVSTVNMKECRIIGGGWTSPNTTHLMYLNCPTNLEVTGGIIQSQANGSFGNQMVFIAANAPSQVTFKGCPASAADPFIGDSSGKSLIKVIGCPPIGNTGFNVLTTAPYNTIPFFNESGKPILYLSGTSSVVNLVFTDRKILFLPMSNTISTYTIQQGGGTAKLPGQLVTVIFQQPATGNPCTLDWTSIDGGIIWAAGGPPVLDPSPGSMTVVTFEGLPLNFGSTCFYIGRASTQFSSSPRAGIGYATGAGGTVVQATSKSTAVTINNVSGQITINNATLTAGTSVSFTLNNTSLQANDVLKFQIVGTSAADPSKYLIVASNIVTGISCTITVRNLSSSDLSEAVVIQFNVMRGASS